MTHNCRRVGCTKQVPHGESHGMAKLDRSAVLAIVAESALGRSPDYYAVFYGVSPSCVRAILKGETWNHVTGFPRYRPMKERCVTTSIHQGE